MGRDWLRELLTRYRGRLIGAAGGLLLGLLIKWVGFFWALFIAILAVAGYQFGRQFDEDGSDGLGEFLDKLLHGRR